MEPKTLLQLDSELLAKAVLHRRQLLMDRLPEMVKQLKEDVDDAQRALTYHETLKGEDGGQSPAMEKQEKVLRTAFNEAIGKLTRAESIFKNSEEIMAYWELRLEEGFDGLLDDSRRVADGGPSSWALRKSSFSSSGGEEE